MPPMVGVPAFLKWVCGPSSRTTCPIRSAARRAIIQGPASSEMASAETAARMARRVR